MSKRKKNLRTQLNWAINSNFAEHIDKRSYKAQNGHGSCDKVFSYSAKYNLKEFSVNFSNYIKENHNEIKDINQITPEVVQSFLNEKAKTTTQNTINTYVSNFKKLEKLINATYERANLNYSKEIVTPSAAASKSANRGSQAQILRQDLDKVIEYAKASECQSAYAIRLQKKLCARVSEIVNIQNNRITSTTVTLSCKGGRELERELDKETKELIQEIQAHNFSNDGKLFSIKDDSVNKYLRETEDKLGIERHSVHDIRRTLAQDYYNAAREQGMSITDAADATSIYLNHNKNRIEMLKECYINLK